MAGVMIIFIVIPTLAFAVVEMYVEGRDQATPSEDSLPIGEKII